MRKRGIGKKGVLVRTVVLVAVAIAVLIFGFILIKVISWSGLVNLIRKALRFG